MYLFLRERERDREGGAEREGERENPSRLRAVSAEPDAGLELTTHEITTCQVVSS